jgi:hypothetical protein
MVMTIDERHEHARERAKRITLIDVRVDGCSIALIPAASPNAVSRLTDLFRQYRGRRLEIREQEDTALAGSLLTLENGLR